MAKDELKVILKRLLDDECIIGKVPNLSEDEVMFVEVMMRYNRLTPWWMDGMRTKTTR
mgnify:CR=1 FL=1